MKASIVVAVGMLLSVGYSCNQPKTIEAAAPANNTSATPATTSTGIFDAGSSTPSAAAPAIAADLHTVEVLESLPTERYVYLRVREGERDFWIATRKQTVEVGKQYFYRGGILKTNFLSQEYNRTFDQIYLVANIVPADHSHSATPAPASGNASVPSSEPLVLPEGSTKIATIVSNPERFAGKTVQVTGRCTKLNANIMTRNWVHLQDGSADGYDFVVTTEVPIPEGHVVTLTGTVAVDRDFGAGYRYDLIVENGQLVR